MTRSKVLFTLTVLAALVATPLAPAAPTVGDDDAGTGTDASDDPAAPTPFVPGYYSGRVVHGADGVDHYSVAVPAGHGVRVAAGGSPSAPDWMGSGPTGPGISYAGGRVGYANENETWSIRVASYAGAGAASNYVLDVRVVPLPPQDDGGSGRDATSARPVAIPRSGATGTVNGYDLRDEYTFPVVAGEVFSVSVRWTDSSAWPPYFAASAPYPNYPEYLGGNATSRTYRAVHTGNLTLYVDGSGQAAAYEVSFSGEAPASPPANDLRANALVLDTLPTNVTQSTAGAGRESNEYYCGALSSVWFAFTPTAPSLVTLDTIGSDFDTYLGVYRGTSSYYVACNGNAVGTASRITDLRVDAGVTYYVQVGGYGGATGELRLNVGALRPLPQVDLAVRVVDIARGPIQTEFGDAPNVVNERRVVTVSVTNEGQDAATSPSLFLTRAPGAARCGSVGSTIGNASVGPLAPGETRLVEFVWDTTTSLGDQTLQATAFATGHDIEMDPSDNVACEQTWVRVGGLGGFA